MPFFPRSHPQVPTKQQGRDRPYLVRKGERYVIISCRTFGKGEQGRPEALVLLPLLSFIARRLWSADSLPVPIPLMVEGLTGNKLWL